MRQIDEVLIRVGRSFRANAWQMVTKIYLPAMRQPIINGVRLGLGVAIIGTLLAETKLSNRGVGFLIIQAYSLFDMPRMYALLIVLFVIAIGANALIGRLGGLQHASGSVDADVSGRPSGEQRRACAVPTRTSAAIAEDQCLHGRRQNPARPPDDRPFNGRTDGPDRRPGCDTAARFAFSAGRART